MYANVIYGLLSNDSSVTSLVPVSKIEPIIIKSSQPVNYPYIVPLITNINSEYTNRGWASDDVSYTLTIVDDNYDNAISITEAVNTALEFKSGLTSDSRKYTQLMRSGYSETYDNDNECYIITINYETKIIQR